jgi:hypothetical protein
MIAYFIEVRAVDRGRGILRAGYHVVKWEGRAAANRKKPQPKAGVDRLTYTPDTAAMLTLRGRNPIVPNTERDALAEAKLAAFQHRVRFSRHARERMQERRAGAHDILDVMSSATKAVRQPPRDKRKLIGGKDIDGDGLDLVVDWTDGDARIVTVLAPTEGRRP